MIFSRVEDFLAKQAWPNDLRRPSWEDLSVGGLPSRSDIVDDIIRRLPKGPVVIVAPPNRGKTFLTFAIARAVADSQASAETRQYYCNAGQVTAAEVQESIGTMGSWIEAHGISHPLTYLCIVDDCHLDEDVGDTVLTATQGTGIATLIALRGRTSTDLPSWAREFRTDHPQHVIFLPARDSFAEQIVTTFIAREGCPPQSTTSLHNFIARNGDDLAMLGWSLRAWRRRCTSTSLSDVGIEVVREFMRVDYALDPLDSIRCSLLLRLALCGSLEVGLPLHAVDSAALATLRLLREEKLVSQLADPRDGYSLSDTKSAEPLLDTLRSLGVTLSIEDKRTHIFALLPKLRPIAQIAALRALASHSELSTLFDSPHYEAGMHAVVSGLDPKTRVTAVLAILSSRTGQAQMATRVKLFAEIAGQVVHELRGASPKRLMRAMPVLASAMNLHHLFRDWTPDDWRATIAAGSSGQLRVLAYRLIRWRLFGCVEQLGRSIVGANTTMLRDPARSTLYPKGIRGFIGNLAQISPTAAQIALSALVVEDLGPLLRHTEGESVSWFCWLVLSECDASTAATFVEKHSQALGDVFTSTSPDHQFWLLWNCYQASPRAATVIASRLALGRRPTATRQSIDMAFCGLLGLCGQPGIRAQPWGTTSVLPLLREEESPAVVALTLAALNSPPTQPDRQEIIEALGKARLTDWFNSFPVERTRKILLQCLLDDHATTTPAAPDQGDHIP